MQTLIIQYSAMLIYVHNTFLEDDVFSEYFYLTTNSANNKKANWRSNSFLLCLHKPSNEMTSFSPSNKQFRKLYSNLNLVVFSLDLNCYKLSTNEFIFAQITCHFGFGKIWILENIHNLKYISHLVYKYYICIINAAFICSALNNWFMF